MSARLTRVLVEEYGLKDGSTDSIFELLKSNSGARQRLGLITREHDRRRVALESRVMVIGVETWVHTFRSLRSLSEACRKYSDFVLFLPCVIVSLVSLLLGGWLLLRPVRNT